MDEYQVKLENISKKIGVLISRYNDLKNDYSALEEENNRLKEQMKEIERENEQLSEDLNVVKLSKQIAAEDENDSAELKKKINEFIKEIDKCVALLND